MDRHPLERYEGSWWLPDTPERRIGGVLELGTEHQLKIFGDLAEKPRLSDPPAIHGECMNRTVTLLQPELRGGRSVVGREGIATYFSPTALIGRNPVAPERTRFDVLSCELNHFATWTARSGIQSRLDDPPAASYTFPDELIAECDDFTLRVSTLFKQAPYDRELNWTEVERIYAYTNEPMPLERLTHAIVRPLQHMLALATGRVCETTRLRVAQSDHAGSHEKLWFDVVYYKGRYGSEDAPEAKRHEFLFTLADIKFADFMPRWFGLVERVGLPCDILFSSRSERERLCEQQALQRCCSGGGHASTAAPRNLRSKRRSRGRESSGSPTLLTTQLIETG